MSSHSEIIDELANNHHLCQVIKLSYYVGDGVEVVVAGYLYDWMDLSVAIAAAAAKLKVTLVFVIFAGN